MGNVFFLVQILVTVAASAFQKLLHKKLVVDSLYDCVVVAQQNLCSRVELVFTVAGRRWPSVSGVFASERISMCQAHRSLLKKGFVLFGC